MTVDGSSGLSLRAAYEQDLAGMAKIHRAAYGAGHFLALLPESTLAEYYRLFLRGETYAVIAESEVATGGPPAIAGFAVFGANIEPRIRQFKREQRAAILRTAMAHPVISVRKAAFSLLRSRLGDSPHDPAPWLLLSIAVRDIRKGVGSKLLKDMIHVAAKNGQQRFGLYVRHTNVGAVNSYLRAGFRIMASVVDQYYMEVSLHPNDSSVTH